MLLVWLQSRRAVDHALSELLAAGPAGERRVRERLELIEHLVSESSAAFRDYCASVRDRDPGRTAADADGWLRTPARRIGRSRIAVRSVPPVEITPVDGPEADDAPRSRCPRVVCWGPVTRLT